MERCFSLQIQCIISFADYDLYTDASSKCGFLAYFQNRWFQEAWPKEIIFETKELSMAYMELYPIVIAAVIWGHEWTGKRIMFHCGNKASVYYPKF